MVAISVQPYSCTMPRATASGERQYVATYQVIVDDKNDGPITARDATGVPRVNDSFVWGNDFDTGAFAVDYGPARWRIDDQTGRKVWLIDVNYSSISDRRNQDFQDLPWDQDPIISGYGIRFTGIATEAADGTAIATSAGEMLVDQRVDRSRAGLRIQQNFQTIDQDQFAEYTDAVNDATFFGLTARKWKMDPPEFEQRWRGDDETPFYTVTFRFQANRETWDLKPADRGSYFLDGNGNPERFTAKGVTIPKGNLDGFGGELTQGDPLEFLTYEYYPAKDFSVLGIPTSL